jgi:hypothetical protein
VPPAPQFLPHKLPTSLAKAASTSALYDVKVKEAR